LVLADYSNSRVRVVAVRTGAFYGRQMTAGNIYTIAGNGVSGFSGNGGPATAAQVQPRGLAIDRAGNVVVGDPENNRVRVVAVKTGTFYGQQMTAGDIYTIAGDGVEGFSGDGGPAVTAELDFPWGVAVDPAGNLVVADSGSSRVRVVAAKTGAFYGQQMTAGNIYTIAGNGRLGFTGDGGPAINAQLNEPLWVAVDGGDVVMADNNRVRLITG
jgi:hypothetical protein